MKFSAIRSALSITLVAFLSSFAGAENLKSGAIALVQIEEGVSVSQLGHTIEMPAIQQFPTYVPGLIIVESESPRGALMLCSNGAVIDFKGSGYFALERFEQELADAPTSLVDREESGQSRMILSLRAGTLVLDHRKLTSSSKVLVEAPFGRISADSRSLWMIDVSRDVRKQSYYFNIYCVEGTIRLFDLKGSMFTVRSGQRISGAGSAYQPSVEVAEITSNAVEYLEGFAQRVADFSETEFSREAFTEVMRGLARASPLEEDSGSRVDSTTLKKGQRPILIEYSSRMAPITPFRGVAEPPSAVEADLF